jgi:hypothetical protein
VERLRPSLLCILPFQCRSPSNHASSAAHCQSHTVLPRYRVAFIRFGLKGHRQGQRVRRIARAKPPERFVVTFLRAVECVCRPAAIPDRTCQLSSA